MVSCSSQLHAVRKLVQDIQMMLPLLDADGCLAGRGDVYCSFMRRSLTSPCTVRCCLFLEFQSMLPAHEFVPVWLASTDW
jgi:hypothetical protein